MRDEGLRGDVALRRGEGEVGIGSSVQLKKSRQFQEGSPLKTESEVSPYPPPFPGAGATLASLMSDISGCSPTVPPLSAEISLSSDPSCWSLSQPIPDLGEGGACPPHSLIRTSWGLGGVAGCCKWDWGQSFVEGRISWGG